jgi:hypothetical protein
MVCCWQVNALTRRYAAFAASCLTLMADHDSDDSEWPALHDLLDFCMPCCLYIC